MADDDAVLQELLSKHLDPDLEALWQAGQRALAASGLSVDDLLAALLAARDEVVREAYGEDFVREMERLRAALPPHPPT